MTDDEQDIIDEVLKDPKLLQELIQSTFTYDNPSDDARMTLGSIEYLTGQRRKEILEVIQNEIEEAINRGSLHRFSGFLDYEP